MIRVNKITQKKASKLVRSLLGLPPKKRRSKKSVGALNRSYSQNLLSSTQIVRKADPISEGMSLAKLLTSTWNSQPNPPQVYILGRRIHHGEIGVGIGLYGLYKKDPVLFGFGLGLVLDDIHDAHDWFTFRPISSDGVFNSYV